MQRYLASMEGAVLSGKLCANAVDTSPLVSNSAKTDRPQVVTA